MMPCLFSVSYAGLWGQAALSLPDFLRKAQQLGYPAVMLMAKRPHLSPLDASDEMRARWKEVLTETGVRCAVLGAYTDFSGAGPGEVPQLEMQIAYVESMARLAQSLGADIVRVFTAYESGAAPLATLWNRTVAALRECCDRAAALGVTIAVQNHHDVAVHSEVLLELLGDIDRPNCKVGYDA